MTSATRSILRSNAPAERSLDADQRSYAARPVVRILGTHGVPARYGGFETAAENVGRHLVEAGWRVIVYCQEFGTGPIRYDSWEGMERVIIPVPTEGWRGTSKFDLISIRHAIKYNDVCLTFGYNTAIFNVAQRLRRVPLVINMDGIEWSRSRWGLMRQAILYVNERIACYVGHELIADHPEIERYLATRAPSRKISMITYGGPSVTDMPAEVPIEYGLTPGRYLTLICRPIPENSILELVRGFSSRRRGMELAVLGRYDGDADPYHREVLAAASGEVRFLGEIYEAERVSALRFHSALYLHGHTVGGTNPSLVEAMGAGNAVLAHDNNYNRWTAGEDAAVFFKTSDDVATHLDTLLDDQLALVRMSKASRARFEREFTWEHVASQYEAVLRRQLDRFSSANTNRGKPWSRSR